MNVLSQQPWWYWLLYIIAAVAYTLFVRELWRTSRESKRRLRVAEQRLARVEETIAWLQRPKEAELAIRLRRQRLARLKATDPQAFVTAVKLAQTDGANLLRAEVVA